MKFSLDDSAASYVIHAYEKGKIRVNNEVCTQSIIITPEQLINPWAPSHIDTLQIKDLELITEFAPEVVLLGTGEKLCFPAAELHYEIQRQGIGLEIMDTASACRTFNVLASEGRRVVAALIML